MDWQLRRKSPLGPKAKYSIRRMWSAVPPTPDEATAPACPSCAQQQTRAVQQITSLFDHLVGAGEQRRRHAEAKRFSSLEVDYEIELLRPLYR
jgi:hypothetical protein